jgi:hypothetical protein
MHISKRALIVTAAIVWYAGGLVLLLKSGALFKNAYATDAHSLWAYTAVLVGAAAGLFKGKFLFSKSCKNNIERINALSNPRIWQSFRPGMLIFLAVIIPAGAWMSRAAAGSYTLLCLVGAFDLSISLALLSSGVVFWKLNAFRKSEYQQGRKAGHE